MPNPLVTLIVPCYNEVEGLPQLLSRLDTMRATGLMPAGKFCSLMMVRRMQLAQSLTR